jgi:hypothetical protein
VKSRISLKMQKRPHLESAPKTPNSGIGKGHYEVGFNKPTCPQGFESLPVRKIYATGGFPKENLHLLRDQRVSDNIPNVLFKNLPGSLYFDLTHFQKIHVIRNLDRFNNILINKRNGYSLLSDPL